MGILPAFAFSPILTIFCIFGPLRFLNPLKTIGPQILELWGRKSPFPLARYIAYTV